MKTGLSQHASIALLAAAGLLASGAASAEEHVVAQKNKSFSVKKLKIKVGDSIKFANEDGFAHNVFSLSPAKGFDTGSFGRPTLFTPPLGHVLSATAHPSAGTETCVCTVLSRSRRSAPNGKICGPGSSTANGSKLPSPSWARPAKTTRSGSQ